jgi:curved DNA-binding protein CbpA
VPPPELDHYALLNVQPTASVEQIKAAYLKQIFQWHPDRNPSEDATRRTAQLNAAWEVLQDPAKRQHYDRQLKRRHTAGASTGTSARSRPERPPARPPKPSPPSDPAAVERARRAAEASAREAEARRQREAEYEQRRKAAEGQWDPPAESALGWTDRDLTVGHWYRNNRGPYKVIDVRGKYVDIYYTDGEITSMPYEDLWRHWQRQVQGRAGPSRSRPSSAHRWR